ncbi:hypothetical protein EVAR_77362_1 [Eumeta japonica]|uniref:Uncharacterized protein n=1 Tax=Eumeta variegata TaxID=151549 RepID=A0A4C1UYH8_EUMVA|nr:hypothetical protein EVAR_77362_1 [Eumeta japonica]
MVTFFVTASKSTSDRRVTAARFMWGMKGVPVVFPLNVSIVVPISVASPLVPPPRSPILGVVLLDLRFVLIGGGKQTCLQLEPLSLPMETRNPQGCRPPPVSYRLLGRAARRAAGGGRRPGGGSEPRAPWAARRNARPLAGMFLPDAPPRSCMVDDVATYLQAPSSGQVATHISNDRPICN